MAHKIVINSVGVAKTTVTNRADKPYLGDGTYFGDGTIDGSGGVTIPSGVQKASVPATAPAKVVHED